MAKAPTKSKRKAPAVVRAAAKSKPAAARAAAKPAASKAKSKSAAKPAPSRKATPVAIETSRKAKPKAAAPSRVKRTIFDAKALAAIKQGLIEERQDLLDQLGEIEEAAFSPEQSEASGEAGFDDDYADAGTATFEREKDLSIANNIQDLIDKINKALNKIDEGTYGVCESCGQPISADRLKALPHVLLCIKCKKAEERR